MVASALISGSLDSSDYSVLSGPDAYKEPYASTLRQLRELRDAGAVAFYFTGPQIAEMAPLDPLYGSSAIGRATLLVELCGRNCLISPERMIANEIAAALRLPNERPEPWSLVGDWFPGGALELVATTAKERRQGVLEAIDAQPANRASRRALKRKLMKQSAQEELRRQIVQQARSDEAALEIQRRYPIELDDARILARYISGDASATQAAAAFSSSLGNPSILYQWMVHQPTAASEFMAWVRAPAKGLANSIMLLAEQTSRLRDCHARFGMEAEAEELIESTWNSKAELALRSMVTQFAKELLQYNPENVTMSAIRMHCPGLVCATQTMYDSCRASLLRNPRMPKDSDFPDILHALYAPYVDLFRADGFMAPIVSRHLKGGQQRVVAKLSQLPNVIRSSL